MSSPRCKTDVAPVLEVLSRPGGEPRAIWTRDRHVVAFHWRHLRASGRHLGPTHPKYTAAGDRAGLRATRSIATAGRGAQGGRDSFDTHEKPVASIGKPLPA